MNDTSIFYGIMKTRHSSFVIYPEQENIQKQNKHNWERQIQMWNLLPQCDFWDWLQVQLALDVSVNGKNFPKDLG